MTLYDLLEQDEGTSGRVYFLNGIPHVGIGHNLINGPEIPLDIQRALCKSDVAAVAKKMRDAVQGWDRLSDARQAVLISIAFQCGMAGFLGFEKMLHAIAQDDYHTAAMELRNSRLAHQNVARTARLAVMLETGHWSPSGGS